MLPSIKVVLVSGFFGISLFGQSLTAGGATTPETASETASDLNVNSRYTIESIHFTGQREYKLSTPALDEIRRLVGGKMSTEALDRLTSRIRTELRAHDVTFKLARGAEPESVRVLIQVDGAAGSFEASVPALSYNSALGFTGTGQIASTIGPNAFTFRMLRDSDHLIERYAGVEAKYEWLALAHGRIQLGFEFDGYRDQYDSATLAALDGASRSSSPLSSLGAGAYGSRLNYQPSATFVIAAPLTDTIGLSFEQLGAAPGSTGLATGLGTGLGTAPGAATGGAAPGTSPGAARSESANAVINSLSYHQRWAETGGSTQELDAGYSLRAATTFLGTDLAYTRHVAHLKYNYSSRTQSVEVTVISGAIYGQAPLFERFALGNSTLLRGWNQYELDPLGGNRLAYGSVTYGYRIMRVFYDTGSVWDRGKSPEIKESAGIGISSGLGVLEKGAFLVAVAFPVREGRVTPVVIAGMNF
jgi:hypothetical protein